MSALEEQCLPDYQPYNFYSVRIGGIYSSRYTVLGKLGYDANSTVWLADDMRARLYVTLRVCTNTFSTSKQLGEEILVYKHLTESGSNSHPGRAYIRTILDTFEMPAGGPKYKVIVQKPLWISFHEFQHRYSNHRLTTDLLRSSLICLLQGLDYLHNVCNIIHTDIKGDNIFMQIQDRSILDEFTRAEQESPSLSVVEGSHITYASRELRKPEMFGLPMLSGFGKARLGTIENDDDIQSDIYRAPEVILKMKWSYSVDIWNVGVMLWDLFENKHMFNGSKPDGIYWKGQHLAEMVAYLGPPPLDFLQRSSESSTYFDEQGHLDCGVDVPKLSLETAEEYLQGNEKTAFLNFVRSMLRWVPEERKTARELLNDPWLKGCF